MNDEKRLIALESVADIAAQCTIDLSCNLKTAYEEYMRGEIPRGAYEYVLHRHGALLTALYLAGYTEKHEFFEFPVKPTDG